MSDDNSKNEDVDFDDAEFDDLDDDLGSEEWDDFDDGLEDGLDEEDAVSDDLEAAPIGKKSFLQKNFNLIVVGVALFGGAAFILPMVTGGGEDVSEGGYVAEDTQNPDDITAMDTGLPVLESAESLPSDQTIEPSEDLFADLDDGLGDSGADLSSDLPMETSEDLISDDVLTPMPEPSDSEDIALSSLDDVIEDDMADSSDLNLDDGLNLDAPIEEETADAPLEGLSSADQDLDALLSDAENVDVPPAPEESSIDVADSIFAEEETAPEDGLTLPADSSVENAEMPLADGNMASEQDSVIEALKSEKETLQSQNSAMELEIAALKEEIKLLKDAQNKTESTPKPIISQQPAEDKQDAVQVPAPAPTPKVIAPKPVEWVLRSAQPGAASISSKNSSDIRQIEVGQTVPGLGRIQSIAVEDGKWVVRGSRGMISQ